MLHQQWPTEAAHIGPHGMSQKADDTEAAPLCSREHHQEGPESLHVLGKKFWEHHGIDWPELRASLIAQYNATPLPRYERSREERYSSTHS